MAITPQTNVRLLKVPIELDNKNQLMFNSIESQFDYFNNLPFIEIEMGSAGRSSYQRKDNIIRYPAHIDNILTYNYVMYQNSNYSDKWFYAFVVNMRYVNKEMTEIAIATDVWQTWQFDLDFKHSFIEREMIDTELDVPGANLIPEGLETGEFKVSGTFDFNMLKPIGVIAYTGNPYDDGLTSSQIPEGFQGVNINGMVTGLYFCIASFDDHRYLQSMLEIIRLKGFSERIMTIFTIPALAVVGYNGLTIDEINLNGIPATWITEAFTANPITTSLSSTPQDIDGYMPNNNKLLTYPYQYLGFTAQNGTPHIFRYENFEEGTPIFKLYSEVNPNPQIFFIPQNYRGEVGNSMSDSCSISGYPTVAWVSDYFNSWLAQNSQLLSLSVEQEQFNYDIGKISDTTNYLGNAISQAFNTDIGGFLSSSANYAIDMTKNAKNHEYFIKNQLAQIEKQQMLPNSSHGGSGNTTLLGYKLLDNSIITRFCIKFEFARNIDSYFDMYGYQTNELKTPNLNNRPHWNYIKTAGANIIADIPQNDLQQIKNLFDNGITLWHNPSTFLDYSQINK